MHLWSEKGTVVSCGPFPMHEVAELRGASIHIQICFELAGGALSRIVHHCFSTCFAVVARQKIGLNGVHSCVQ